MINIVSLKKEYQQRLYEIHCNEMPENDKLTKDCFFDEFNQKTRKYFVALEDTNPVGYIGVMDTIDDYNIIGIAVDKNYQNKGIGGKLLQEIINTAKKNNVLSISLEVDEFNEKAINFYKNKGFVVTNIRKKYYKDNDAYIMFLYL